MTYRKYIAESGVNLYSSGATVIQPTDIYEFSQDEKLRDILGCCNIYLIVRRRKIDICTNSLKIVDRYVHGDFKVQDGSGYEKHRFKGKQQLDGNILNVFGNNFPENRIHFQAFNGQIATVPAFKFVFDCESELEGKGDLEVLYVGQSYGKEGEILALDRLSAHRTLQRILADTLYECPDHEVLLLLFRYEHYKKISSTEGDFSLEPQASEEEEKKHFERTFNVLFERRNRVSLAEAGLISYFKPPYNKIYKETFPSRKHKILEELLNEDFSSLMIEIDTSNIGTKLYSDSAGNERMTTFFKNLEARGINDKSGELDEMRYVHIIDIPLYSKDKRNIFLHSIL